MSSGRSVSYFVMLESAGLAEYGSRGPPNAAVAVSDADAAATDHRTDAVAVSDADAADDDEWWHDVDHGFGLSAACAETSEPQRLKLK